jgi:hypothetical protein
MKNKEFINQQVEATFNAIGTIEKVKANHFFKHKVLQQLNNRREEKTSILARSTSSVQLATIALLILLNLSVVVYAFASQEQITNTPLDTFAQEYSLQSESISLLN